MNRAIMKLTDAQKQTMLKLRSLPVGKLLVVSALADQLKKSPSAVGKILKSLHKKKLVSWNPEKDCYVTNSATKEAKNE